MSDAGETEEASKQASKQANKAGSGDAKKARGTYDKGATRVQRDTNALAGPPLWAAAPLGEQIASLGRC